MKAHEINELEALDELKIAIWLVKNRVDAFDEDFDETFLSDDLAMMPDQLRAALETAARILLRAKNHHDTMLAIHQHEWCRERDDAKAAAFRSRQQAAHAAVAAAIQSGSLVRPTHCDECPEQADNIVAHHDDYGKPLDVKWLCRSCHGKHHAEHGSAT